MPKSVERAKSKSDALERYKRFLQRTLVCVADTTWQVGEARVSGHYSLVLAGDPIRLRPANRQGEDRDLYLKASQDFSTEEKGRRDWKVSTKGYAYTITDDPDLHHELVAWHWHPGSRPDTHIHIGHSHPEYGALAKLHIPAGRVSFEEVVRFLIVDMRVETKRNDWDAVITDSLTRFKDHRSWA